MLSLIMTLFVVLVLGYAAYVLCVILWNMVSQSLCGLVAVPRLLVEMLPKLTIIVDGKDYLTRHYLLLKDHTEKKFNLFVHHFKSSDQFQNLHNHPWRWGIAIVFWGGYIEERITCSSPLMLMTAPITVRKVRAFSINFIRKEDFHRVTLLNEASGAWSLFIAGPRHSEWGFLDRDSREFKHFTTNPNAIP